VATKMLPGDFAADSERARRFEREARTISKLNHPHICALYDLGQHDGSSFLVMEYLEGESLAERLTKGPLPLPEAIRCAKEIAEALAEAHQQGIIHRDLKPANVVLTKKGAKLLDFGIAKLRAGAVSEEAPTATASELTGEGVIVGTPQYMAPEQLEGKPVDARTDVFAFGVVLYEMVTGRKAFDAPSRAALIAAILKTEPAPLARTQPQAPAWLDSLVRRCLAKDPRERWPSFGELLAALGSGGEARSRRRRAVASVALALAVPALVLAAGWLLRQRGGSGTVTSPSEYVQLTNFTDSAVAPSLSPDGRMVTFIRGGDFFLSRGQVYVKQLPSGEPVQLTNEAGFKYGPVFTPDGSRIAYTNLAPAGTSLSWDTWTVPLLGGQPTRLLPNASGLVWIADHRLLFAEIKTGLHMGIVTATESRAERREIYFPGNERAMAHYAYASPDRQSVLVVEMDATHHFSQPCRLVPFDGSSAGRQVGPQGTCTSAAWSPDGKWMYFGVAVRGSSHIWRQRFPDGGPEQITFGPTEEEGVALAPDGRSLVTSLGTRRSAIWIHDASGERALSSEGYARLPRLSRAGTRVFYLVQQDSSATSGELRTADLGSGRTESVLPGTPVADYAISPDETEVAYTTTDDSGESQIWLASLDRRTPPRQIARSGDQVSFGAHGDLVFRSLDEKTSSLVRIKRDGSQRERITTTPILDKYDVSPDGEWVIAFSPGAGEDARPGTLAVPVRGGAPRTVCFPGSHPSAWSSNGRFLYVPIGWGPAATSPRKTAVIPVPAGKSLPDLPASGIDGAAGQVDLPGARVIERGSISPGPDPSTYVFTKSELERNLFRIPLH
jgi:Tol biopolymer transport system component